MSDRPKPMAEVCGHPFLFHLLRYWAGEGIERFVLLTGYKGEMISEHFGREFVGATIEYVREEAPLGTGGALLACFRQKDFKDPFIVLNGDTFFEGNLSVLCEYAEDSKADWVMSLFESGDNKRYLPVQLSDTFEVTGFKVSGDGPSWSNGGVYYIHPAVLSGFTDMEGKLSMEDDLLVRARQKNYKIHGLRWRGTFIDIGLPGDLEAAQRMSCFQT